MGDQLKDEELLSENVDMEQSATEEVLSLKGEELSNKRLAGFVENHDILPENAGTGMVSHYLL